MEYVERRPALSALLEDDRVYGVIEELLGPGFVWIPSDGNIYVGDTEWHPDRREILPDYSVIKIAFYLDPVGRESGCLRVIPGSHRDPLHGDLMPLFKHRGETPEYPRSGSRARMCRPTRSSPTPATWSCSTRTSGTPPTAAAATGACSP
jgi:hypothetical protein